MLGRLVTAISVCGLGSVMGLGCSDGSSSKPSSTTSTGGTQRADSGVGGAAESSGGRAPDASGTNGGATPAGGSSTAGVQGSGHGGGDLGGLGGAGGASETGTSSGTGGAIATAGTAHAGGLAGTAAIAAGGAVNSAGEAGLIGPGSAGQPSSCESIAGLVETDCSAVVVPSAPMPSYVLLVIDKSGSMQDESVYGRPKWDALSESLSETLNGDNVANNPRMSLGLLLFPGEDVSDTCSLVECCSLPESTPNIAMGSAPETVGDIVDLLARISPAGLTPTSAALDRALAYYQAGGGAALQGTEYVLLATDGGPNCNGELACSDDECTLALDGQCSGGDCCASAGGRWCVDWQETQDKIGELASLGIKTVVVGMPGTEAYSLWLDGFADAGQFVAPSSAAEGGPHYYTVDPSGGVLGLTGTLQGVFQRLTRTCTRQLDAVPATSAPSSVNVAVDCAIVPAADWHVDHSTEPPSIEITGAYCDRILEGAPVDVLAGCPLP